MKKTILTTFILGALLASCGSNGKKVETQDAQEVTETKTKQTQVYNKIAAASTVEWRASHLGGAQPRFGEIKLKSAKFSVNNNELTNASVVMDMSSLTVESFPDDAEKKESLTGHLKSADFFDIEKNPTSTFEITKVEKGSGEFLNKITGNLTIMGVSKSITFSANVAVNDQQVSIKSEKFAVDRKDWNLTYHAEGSEGVPTDYLIADRIGFTIDVSVNR